MVRGSQQYRLLIISNDECNDEPDIDPWGVLVVRVDAVPDMVIRLSPEDPLSGAVVDFTRVMRVDRTALRDNHGFVSNDTMNAVEYALRDFLNLP